MKHCLTFLPDAYLATKIPDMSGKNLTYGNPRIADLRNLRKRQMHLNIKTSWAMSAIYQTLAKQH